MKPTRASFPFSSLVFLAAPIAVAACQSPADEAEPEASADEIVGLADLALLEQTFGLVPDAKTNGRWSRDATTGRCYQAYGQRPGIEFRRYANGAAFFLSRVDYERERGDDRPVLCVDLDGPGMALDGVGLDAVFRFDLGKAIGVDSATGGEADLVFARGRLHVRRTSPAPPSADHGAALIEAPRFLEGELLDVKIAQADVFEPFTRETHRGELVVSGSLAAFAHAAAWAKTGAAFSLARDPLGPLSGLSSGGDRTLRAEQGGDGPGWWQGLYFPVATISEAGYGEFSEEGSRYVRTFRVSGPSNPGDAYVERADVECELTTVYRDLDDQVGVTQPIACKGL